MKDLEIEFVFRKEMKSVSRDLYSSIDRVIQKIKLIKEEYDNNRGTFLLNLVRYKLPKKECIGLFTPPNNIKINIESIYRFFPHSQATFVNRLTKTIIHESLHYILDTIQKELKYNTENEHKIIREMGY